MSISFSTNNVCSWDCRSIATERAHWTVCGCIHQCHIQRNSVSEGTFQLKPYLKKVSCICNKSCSYHYEKPPYFWIEINLVTCWNLITFEKRETNNRLGQNVSEISKSLISRMFWVSIHDRRPCISGRLDVWLITSPTPVRHCQIDQFVLLSSYDKAEELSALWKQWLSL